jgi:dethiobiotin synthase
VGTDTDVGKTVISTVLSLFGARRGPVRYWKPVQTGTDLDTVTVSSLVHHENFESGEPCYEFPLPASPHAAAADVGKSIHVPTLDQALRRERTQNPEAPLIIELAGGLLVPYTSEVTQIDWLAAHRLPLVLVARSGLGTLNHTMLSLEALHSRGLHPEVLFLVGKPHPSNRATLEQMSGIRTIYELPRFDELDKAALDGWLDENDLRPLFRLVRAMR